MGKSGLNVSMTGEDPFPHQTPQGFGLVIGVARQKDAAVLREALSKSGLSTEHISSKTSGDAMGLELFVGPKP
jgi:hypothetical protein